MDTPFSGNPKLFWSARILKPLVLTLLMYVARVYHVEKLKSRESLSDQITSYIYTHADSVTLKEIAHHFGYHPNYISTLMKKETGITFSDIVREKRMQKAKTLLTRTTLAIEDIAYMLGYHDTSNFYKAYKSYYGTTPRRNQT